MFGFSDKQVKKMSETNMEQTFAELQEVLTDTQDALAMYERLHKLQPGNTDYDAIRDHYTDNDDPDKSTRDELQQTVRVSSSFRCCRAY